MGRRARECSKLYPDKNESEYVCEEHRTIFKGSNGCPECKNKELNN